MDGFHVKGEWICFCEGRQGCDTHCGVQLGWTHFAVLWDALQVCRLKIAE